MGGSEFLHTIRYGILMWDRFNDAFNNHPMLLFYVAFSPLDLEEEWDIQHILSAIYRTLDVSHTLASTQWVLNLFSRYEEKC